MKERVEHIGNCTLYLGDCRDILPTLGSVDAVVTDPMYGVGLEYELVEDTEECVRAVSVPVVNWARKNASVVAVTPGTRHVFHYPIPTEMGCLYFPAGTGFSRWGFTCFQPILFYGKDPHPTTNKRPNSYRSTESSERNGHPCPKPIGLIKWLVDRTSLSGWTVCDPFMGSGTTGIACIKLNRKFIGIEIVPRYFDIACKRIDEATRQGDLFHEPSPKPEQLEVQL